MNNHIRKIKIWCACFVATGALSTFCIKAIDLPAARFFIEDAARFEGIGKTLGGSVIVSVEIVLMLVLVLTRIVRQRLSRRVKALLIASGASISTFAANDFVLKIFFGRLPPTEIILGHTIGTFRLFQGTPSSSFPSGHMASASSFALVVARLYPKTALFWIVALLVIAAALIIGGWHFISDILAGAFLGSTAAFIATELWLEHIQQDWFKQTSDHS